MCFEGFLLCLYSPEDDNSLIRRTKWDAIDLLPAIFLSEPDYPMSTEIISAQLRLKFKAKVTHILQITAWIMSVGPPPVLCVHLILELGSSKGEKKKISNFLKHICLSIISDGEKK